MKEGVTCKKSRLKRGSGKATAASLR